jgi:serine protease Do
MNRWSFAAAGLLVGGVLGCYFFAPVLYGQPKQAVPPIPKELTSYRDIVKRILPAVVSLEVTGKNKAEAPSPESDIETVQEPGKAPKPGFGSGVLVDPRGIVLTSFHVVEGGQSVEVTLGDGRKIVSRDIRGDKKTDIAIVVLDKSAGVYPYLQLGDSDAMEIGDRVLAVGAPFGLSGSVTHGIISGKGRSGLNLNTYEDFLQTDAAINPGNSGGPLIALDGKVVGINAAIKSKSGGFQGVGLAVASNICKSVLTGLMNEGVVRRGYLGLQVRDLLPAQAAELKQAGVVVTEVYDNTPASRSGLKPGDVITTFGGRPVPDTKTLQNTVVNLPLKKAVQVQVLRNGKAMTLSVTIEELPDSFGVQESPAPAYNKQPLNDSSPSVRERTSP